MSGTELSSAEPPALPVRKPQKALDVVGREAEAKFKAAQAKAAKVGVENLTEKDIDGLSFEQIKLLRGTSGSFLISAVSPESRVPPPAERKVM